MRTSIHRSNWVKPLLWLFGGTDALSYVEIEDNTLHVRFGFLFNEQLPVDKIVSVERQKWPIIGGLGWRTNLIDEIALVGSYSNVVRLRFSPRIPLRLLRRMNVESLYISVEDPDAFIAEIRGRIAARKN